VRTEDTTGLCECGCGELAPTAKRNYGTMRIGDPFRFVPGHQRRKSPVEYVVDEATGCWLWQRAKTNGYGVVTVAGRQYLAHRVVYERHKGAIPEGLELDHTCPAGPNKACVNPDHLDPVTHAVNLQRSKQAKLTREIAEAIRANPEGLHPNQLAARHGVHPSTIYNVIARRQWND
jgi:hypothetical protein